MIMNTECFERVDEGINWPRYVNVMGHSIGVENSALIEHKIARYKSYNLTVDVELLPYPEMGAPSISSVMFGYTSRTEKIWNKKCAFIRQLNEDSIQNARDSIRTQLSIICDCPEDAVTITVRSSVDFSDTHFTVMGSCPLYVTD